MSQKRSTLLIWAAVIFILIVTCLITDRNNLAERTLYSSQEEMQSALQDTFVYYTARGERQAWSIHGDTAIQTYENGAVFSYTITKWRPQRGALTLTLDTTTQVDAVPFVDAREGCKRHTAVIRPCAGGHVIGAVALHFGDGSTLPKLLSVEKLNGTPQCVPDHQSHHAI